MSAGAAKPAVVDLAEAFRRETGHTVQFTFVAFLTSPPARSKFIAVGLDHKE
ncbi:MAG: hypothetical protein HYU32_09315 [candidate division NC10 bacterium]|nr:hypothetical protein [candidate division NC10 bacterium]